MELPAGTDISQIWIVTHDAAQWKPTAPNGDSVHVSIGSSRRPMIKVSATRAVR
jgi:hypothetical protein